MTDSDSELIQKKKEEIIHLLETIESVSDDKICETMLTITTNIEDIIKLTRTNKEIHMIEDVKRSLFDIKDFSDYLLGYWKSICKPGDTMEHVKTLKSILIKEE